MKAWSLPNQTQSESARDKDPDRPDRNMASPTVRDRGPGAAVGHSIDPKMGTGTTVVLLGKDTGAGVGTGIVMGRTGVGMDKAKGRVAGTVEESLPMTTIGPDEMVCLRHLNL